MVEGNWRHSLSLLPLRLSWDRYILCTALWTGWALAIGSAAFHYQASPPTFPTSPLISPTSLPSCSDATSLCRWLLSVSCLHVLLLALLTSLRDRRGSLQVRSVFCAKALQAGLFLLALLAALALTIALAVSLSSYSASSSIYCPPAPDSVLYGTAAATIPLSFLNCLYCLRGFLSLVYHRLVFAHPPLKSSSPHEADALTWIRARTGDIIPTLLIVPPTVDLSRTTPGQFPCHTVLLYSHANATDLEDSIFVLRALAETFDCGVLSYEWPGYGSLCGSEASEDGCYAAVEAAYNCLIDYHHASPSQIILYGRSLGTGPSVWLAQLKRSEMAGLVMQSPPLSVLRAGCGGCVRRTLPFDLFPSCDRIAELTLPTFILHGERDTVVPFTHALRLHESLSDAAAFPPLWVPDGDHQRQMPKPWLYSTEKAEADSDARYEEKMRINARNAVYIARMREFIHHCHQRAFQAGLRAKAPGSPLSVDPSLPVLPLDTQRALLEALSETPVAVRAVDEEKVAEGGLLSPVATTRHAIFALADRGPPVLPTTGHLSPSLHPLSPSSHPFPPSHQGAKAVSAPPSAGITPRGQLPLSPVSAAGPPLLLSLPTSLPLFGFPTPQYPLPALPLGDDDSPPLHVRTQSATAALRASSRITSYPHSRHRPRRSITVNTVERPKAPDPAQGLDLHALLADAATREVRLVRDTTAGGTWRVERSAGDEGGGTQTQGSSGPGARRPRRSLSESPPERSTSLQSLHQMAIVVREEERKEEASPVLGRE